MNVGICANLTKNIQNMYLEYTDPYNISRII